jgi:hypothetical protein
MTRGSSFRSSETKVAQGTGVEYSELALRAPAAGHLSKPNVAITEESVIDAERSGEGHLKATALGTGESPAWMPIADPEQAPESISEAAMVKPSTPHGKPFVRGNKAARGRKPKLAMLGVDLKYLNIQDERYKSSLRRAEFYLKRRSRELAVMFGFSSAGVNGILGSAALQLAASKYLSQLASEFAGVDMQQFIELQKMAMQLQNSAKSNELAAYEMCAKESSSTRKAMKSGAPWLEASGNMDLEEK